MFVLLYPLYYLYLTNCNTLVRNNESVPFYSLPITFFPDEIAILIFMKLESADNVKLTNRISIIIISCQKRNKILNVGNSRYLKSDFLTVWFDRQPLTMHRRQGIIQIAENRGRVDPNTHDSGVNSCSASTFVISQC